MNLRSLVRAACYLDGATILATRKINERVESSRYLYTK